MAFRETLLPLFHVRQSLDDNVMLNGWRRRLGRSDMEVGWWVNTEWWSLWSGVWVRYIVFTFVSSSPASDWRRPCGWHGHLQWPENGCIILHVLMHGESHHAQRTEDATNDDGLGYCLQTVQPLVLLLFFYFPRVPASACQRKQDNIVRDRMGSILSCSFFFSFQDF